MLNLFKKNKSELLKFIWQETPTGIQFVPLSDNFSLTDYVVNLPKGAYQEQAHGCFLRNCLITVKRNH